MILARKEVGSRPILTAKGSLPRIETGEKKKRINSSDDSNAGWDLESIAAESRWMHPVKHNPLLPPKISVCERLLKLESNGLLLRNEKERFSTFDSFSYFLSLYSFPFLDS